MTGVAPVPVRDGLFRTDPPALLGSRCRACQTIRFPTQALCARCQSTDVEAVALSTTGTVHTFTVVHHRPPGYVGPLPYAIGIVELPDGLRVASTLTADDLAQIRIDAPCRFELLELPDADPPLQSFAYRVGVTA